MNTFEERYETAIRFAKAAREKGNEERAKRTLEICRSREIAARICAKHTRDDQLALLMDKDKKPEEWNAYQAFRAVVKAEVDAEIEQISAD